MKNQEIRDSFILWHHFLLTDRSISSDIWWIFGGLYLSREIRIYTKLLPCSLHALREECPYLELFFSTFSCIQTECGEVRSNSSYSAQMRENTNQNNSEYRHFIRSDGETWSCSPIRLFKVFIIWIILLIVVRIIINSNLLNKYMV